MSKTAKKVLIVLLLLFIILLLAGIAIYFNWTLNKTATNETLGIEDVETAPNLEEMVDAADVIAVGRYEGLHSTVNLARDKEDASKESTEEYLGAKVYRFHIDKLLKGGSSENMIRIAHRYSGRFKIEETLGHQDKEVEQADPTFIKPSFTMTYMVFINEPELGDFYTQSLEPYMVTVNDEDIVEVKSNIGAELNFDDTISGEELDELETEIKALK